MINRRDFIKKSLAAAVFPTILPASVFGRNGAVAPSNRVTLAHIGCGHMARNLRNVFCYLPDAQIVACADVERSRLNDFKNFYDSFYQKNRGQNQGEGVALYDDFLEVLARPDIDGVIIATPDHWHATMTIAACRAGKDVYCEKPLTHTVGEAYDVASAVKQYGRVLQTGSMQRSSQNFRFAVEMVRNGRIGNVHTLNVAGGAPPKFLYDLREENQDAMNWDRWVGPSTMQPYNSFIAPTSADYKDWPGWRFYSDFGGGVQCDWGAHQYDIAQWALNRDGDTPVEVIPSNSSNPEQKALTYRYADGVQIVNQGSGSVFTGLSRGVEFIGDEGAIYVNRGVIETKPTRLRLEPTRGDELTVYESTSHARNFVDCVKSRQKPICDEVVGASSAVVCHLGNIAEQCGEAFKFDYKTGLTDSAAANRLLNPPKRPQYAV
ncbi:MULTISPECIES: Gfo/Idh/MocA family protein [unclassified Lentimonas]|uniref:Gfo/Idh/MocA family protein n=1 Tax=unclassified Lentimonas TaxID=2630993 RepID=UPI001321049B|nr:MULTISPECIES: Gfo/Idh/MocA family oxidoreductase [unclassified Lentimonas]CAA6689974.1 Myo-inositol 2-dehydrogenase (EC [Lentimonas sp. CC10]CAA6691050.1 Myo-inositol 2-dehydrogenase (EC [Lentimonas sp. CC19]CAA7069336.1 Myo-inositol 2-dehydrogenase (EC [Lentimonas sp. CC11]